MRTLTKKEGLRKVKFYDNWLWFSLFCLVVFVLAILLNRAEEIQILFLIMTIIPLGVVWGGVLSNLWKRRHFGWYWVTVLIPICFLMGTIVYFTVIRKELKEGKPIPKKEFDFFGNKN